MTQKEKQMKRWSTGSPEEQLNAALKSFWINHMARIKEARLERGEK